MSSTFLYKYAADRSVFDLSSLSSSMLLTPRLVMLAAAARVFLGCEAPFNDLIDVFCVHLSPGSVKVNYCGAQKYCHNLGGELLMGKKRWSLQLRCTLYEWCCVLAVSEPFTFHEGDAKLIAYKNTRPTVKRFVGLTDSVMEKERSKVGWVYNDGELQSDTQLWEVCLPFGNNCI